MTPSLENVRGRLAQQGVRGSAAVILDRARPRRAESAAYVWYELDLHGERPRRELSEGLELRVATSSEIHLLGQLPSDGAVTSLEPAGAARRLEEGATLWLVTEGDRVAFACWTFPSTAPVWAAREAAIPLPDGMVCLEDSHSSPDFQGRGVAPAAWAGIADRLAAEGFRAMLTKVGEDNAASRRAVEKAGFLEVARMRMGRRGWAKRLKISLPPGSPRS